METNNLGMMHVVLIRGYNQIKVMKIKVK